MKKNLILCPNCEYNGKKQVLGEIDQDGNLVVMRFHKGTTKIIGSIFNVECGECGEPVYKKGGESDGIGSVRIAWLHREAFIQTPGTIGAYSGTN